MKILRLVLGDQLNMNHSWFKKPDDSVTYIMMEVRTETDYALHHIQKVLAFFAAMQNFAAELKDAGHQVIYIKINDQANRQSFEKNIDELIHKKSFTHFEYQLPDEYRLDKAFKKYTAALSISHKVFDTEHFFCSREGSKEFFTNKNNYLMESFYRFMRKKHQILMNGDEPFYGKWNYDADNRKKIPASHTPITPLIFENDLTGILHEIKHAGIKTMGTVDAKNFIWPVNRTQSLQLLAFFIKECLPFFGSFQDAMQSHQWSLYHSRLSFCMNSKMLSPAEVIDAAIKAWQKRPKEISYNQLEGFVRQIIGWREYMRSIYWLKMPEYASLNYFNHENALPQFYWNAQTKMNCLKQCIGQSLQYAYAHHIQRLMVTGNFALLADVHPDELDAWYLGIYIDAIEWVEITNTRGMSQFADGGIVGTKPYVSAASYIDKMSNYCKGCYYDKTKKTGPRSCPFNSLYWHFYHRHQDKLAGNPRIGMMYHVWNKMSKQHQNELLQQADDYLKNIDNV